MTGHKIALIGSAPSSVALAPYDDPTWQIWACSPGARPYVKRTNAWFEMHLWEPEQPWFSKEYVDFMAGLTCPVFTLDKLDALPTSVPYPKDVIVERFGVEAVWFFTSTVAWMMALAIESNPSEIGLWGIDMSAGEEIYSHQRAGCQFFIGQAMKRGIKVTVPHQSDLMMPTPLYGYNEQHNFHQKLLARRAELQHRINLANNQFAQLQRDIPYLTGALEDVNYMHGTWVQDRQVSDIIGKYGHQLARPPEGGTPAEPPAPTPVAEPVEQPAAEIIQVAPAPDGTFNHKLPDATKVDVTGHPLLDVPPVTWSSTPAPEFLNGLG
jgi:hypothetical protein